MTPHAARTSRRRHLEIEVKLRIHGQSLRRIRSELMKLGCEKTVARNLERNWTWDFPTHTLRQKGQLLRVRQVAGRCLFTFKGPARQSTLFKIREERETEVQDPVTLGVILERLGLEVVSCYEKFRTSYALRMPSLRSSVHLAIDETPIGNYLEIEGRETDIQKVAAKLGFERERFINESYLALFEKSSLRRTQRNMTFRKE